MRNSFVQAFCLYLVLGCLSCQTFGSNNVNITISENEDIYTMSSNYNKNKTKKVQQYMENQLGGSNNISFVNTELDAQLTLNDLTNFYVKSTPGEIRIKMDRTQNTHEGYARVKAMCEGIKTIIEKD